MSGRVLAVRLDNDGDVLLTGPAVRALAAGGDVVDLLVAPSGQAAATLLPLVSDILVFDPPWSGFDAPPTDPPAIEALVTLLRRRAYDQAVVFTSFHQSALPMALLCRLAGIPHVAASSELVQNETFGPVAPVIRVRSTAEAIEVANGTPYGLQAGVVTRDITAFWEIAAGLRVGAVNLDHGPHFDSPHIPFGGVKASGVGREGIRCSVREMSTIKTVTVPFPAASR